MYFQPIIYFFLGKIKRRMFGREPWIVEAQIDLSWTVLLSTATPDCSIWQDGSIGLEGIAEKRGLRRFPIIKMTTAFLVTLWSRMLEIWIHRLQTWLRNRDFVWNWFYRPCASARVQCSANGKGWKIMAPHVILSARRRLTEYLKRNARTAAGGSLLCGEGRKVLQRQRIRTHLRLEIGSDSFSLSYDVTYDTSNSARHGFLNFHFAVRRAIYAPVFLLCSAVIFFCTSFQVSLSTIAGWEFST